MLSPALTALERRWHDEIPLSAAMGLKIVDGNDGALASMPLAPNRNVHGTGFAGSLYAAAALCGWGQVALTLEAAGLEENGHCGGDDSLSPTGDAGLGHPHLPRCGPWPSATPFVPRPGT